MCRLGHVARQYSYKRCMARPSECPVLPLISRCMGERLTYLLLCRSRIFAPISPVCLMMLYPLLNSSPPDWSCLTAQLRLHSIPAFAAVQELLLRSTRHRAALCTVLTASLCRPHTVPLGCAWPSSHSSGNGGICLVSKHALDCASPSSSL